MNGHLGKQHSSVTLELRCRSALHLAIPEQAPSPVPAFQLSGALTFRSFHSRPTTWGYVPGGNIFSFLGRLLPHQMTWMVDRWFHIAVFDGISGIRECLLHSS